MAELDEVLAAKEAEWHAVADETGRPAHTWINEVAAGLMVFGVLGTMVWITWLMSGGWFTW